MEKYCIYLRKSRADGEHETVEQVLSRHETQLQEYAEKTIGKRIPEKNIYREIVSGETIQDRPQMQKILNLVQSGDCIGILVVDPQRLSRGDMMDCGTIIRAFQYSRTLIMTPPKTYNLEDKFDRKFFEMELMRGSDYLEYTKEILARGRAASVNAGYFVGSVPPYGYDKIKDGKHYTLVPNKEADTVKLIFDMFVNQHIGTTAIARKLDTLGIKARNSEHWAQYSVRDILQNPVYIGKIRWNQRKTVKSYKNGAIVSSRPLNRDNNIIVEGRHSAIIDEETFNKTQQCFGTVARTKGWSQLRNPFATLVKCKKCGRSMSYRTYLNKDGSERNVPRLICDNQVHCKTKSVTYKRFEDAVILSLKKYISKFECKLKDDNGNLKKQQLILIENLNKELEDIEKQQIQLYDLLETQVYTKDIFLMRNSALAERRENIKKSIEKSENSVIQFVDYREVIFKFQNVIDSLQDNNISAKSKNDLLKTVLTKIEYSSNALPKSKDDEFLVELHFKDNLFL